MFYFLIFLNSLFLILMINAAVKLAMARFLPEGRALDMSRGRIINFSTKQIKTQSKPITRLPTVPLNSTQP